MRYWYLHASIPTAPNGLNLRKSVGNPNSRLEKVRTYLAHGPRTKREILRDVFGKEIGTAVWVENDGHWVCENPNVITRGWGSMFFSIAHRQGYLKKIRKGNTVLWSI